MEEDIKSIINFLQHLGLIKEAKTIRDLLSVYKKLEEEFKTVDHECSRLEKKEYDKEDKYLVKIKELEEENKRKDETIKNLHNALYRTGKYTRI